MNRWLDGIKQQFASHRYAIMLCLGILIVIYPISLFVYIPKWDSVIAYLPYRYFISDYLWNGHLPLWSPFQRFGYPGYSDLQSGFWYPLMWLILLGGKYTMTSLMVELSLTFLAAGLGMFTLSRYLFTCPRTALLLGLTYALSGFMIGSAQLMVFLIGMAWLPWCIWALLRWLKEPTIRHSLAVGFFVALNLTGASPAFTIIMAYLVAGIVLVHFIARPARFLVWKRYIRSALLSGLWLVCFLLPFILAFTDFAPYFNRSGKLPYDAVTLNPFVLADYISFFTPYVIVANTDWFAQTDLSLRDAYSGWIVLLAFGVVILQWRSWRLSQWFLFSGFLLALLLALGDNGPLFKWAYHLPGFGMFRHPSFFRGYAIFALLLLVAPAVRSWLRGEQHRTMIRALVAGGVILIAIGVWSASRITVNELSSAFDELLNRSEFPASGPHALIVINVIALLVIAFICGLLWRFRAVNGTVAISLFVFADLFVHAVFVSPTTLHYPVQYAETKPFFRELPDSHDQSRNLTPFSEFNDQQDLKSAPGVYLNLATYHRALSIAGENPMRFKAFDEARDTEVLQYNLSNTLFWVPVQSRVETDSIHSGVIWEVPFTAVPAQELMVLTNPLVNYNAFAVEVGNPSGEAQWLVLNQNYHHRWQCRMGDRELPVRRVNEMVMAVEIPGETTGIAEWTYTSPLLPGAMGIGALAFGLLCFVMLSREKK